MTDNYNDIVTNPIKLAQRIKETTLSQGYNKDGYPVLSTRYEYHQKEWELIIKGLENKKE